MARLAPEFRHDIFVSYSHGDVKGDGTSLLKTWSQGFARELEAGRADPIASSHGFFAVKAGDPALKPGDTAWVLPSSEVNLRAAPNVNSPLVAQLRRSAQLKILGDNAVRNEDDGQQAQWLTVELYSGDFCLPSNLGKQAICANWQLATPNSPPPTPIKGWINRNKIVQVQP